jgi:tetratricopeptide (TPR) repeat protein
MSLFIHKRPLGLAFVVLCLLASCSLRQGITIVDTDPSPTPQKITITQTEENLGTPLHQAILKGDLEAVRSLLVTADVNTPDSQGNTSLHVAVLQNNIAVVALLVEAKAALDVKNIEGLTPLHLAAANGSVACAQLLLENKAAIHAKEEGGRTPLYLATQKDHQETMQVLLKHGANENDKRVVIYLSKLKDDSKDVRGSVVDALGKIQSSTPEVISGLITALKDNSEGVRHSAADAFGALKSSTPEVISGLITALKDNDEYVRSSAADALGKIQSSTPEVISALIIALKDNERDVRRRAADALGALKSSTPEVISGLITALKDQGWNVRHSAADAFGKIQYSTLEVISGLLTALKDKNWKVRGSAADALGKMQSSTPEVIGGLLIALKDRQSFVRISAIASLKIIEANLQDGLLKGVLEALRETKAIKDEKITAEYKAIKEGVEKLWNLISSNGQLLTANKKGALADILGNSQEHIHVLRQLGDYYYKTLDYEKAAVQYAGFLALHSVAGTLEEQALVLAHAAQACTKANNPILLNLAEDFLGKAKLLFDSLKENGQLSQDLLKEYVELLIHTGSFYLTTSNYDETAEKYYDLALQETKANQGELGLAHLEILSRKALLFLKQRNYDKAIKKFKEARIYYKKPEKKDSTDKIAATYISICKGLASSYIAINKMEKAWALCEEAFERVPLLNKESFAGFSHTIESVIELMNLQISSTKDIHKRDFHDKTNREKKIFSLPSKQL